MQNMKYLSILLLAGLVLSYSVGQEEGKKKLLAIGASAGFQHDSVSDALATLYLLGQQSGLWDTFIRTDTQLLTKQKLGMNARNLDYFDAVFFMTTGELPLDEQQKADFLSFIRDDGKGFLGAHNATDTFYKWSHYGDMIGGYFDGHPWNQFEAPIRVEDQDFPATAHFPSTFAIHDEIYQIRNFSRAKVHVLMSLDTSKVDMDKEGVKHSEIPVTWLREYGRGRVFYSGLGHRQEVWQRSDIQRMWLEAVKWAMKIEE